MTRPPTTAKLRHDIDHGRGGDKVAAIDPAASPLGTDDEAAGTPPSPGAVVLAHKHEIRTSRTSFGTNSDQGVAIYISVVVAGITAVASAIAFI